MNELALFAGAGGGILAGTLLGWRTVCAVECDEYAAAVLAVRQNDGILEPFPIWDNVQTFDGSRWRGIVDVVSGGFPCQDISLNGEGRGIDGERSGLWSHMARIIREVRPRFVFVENSPALTSRGLDIVIKDLAEMGFFAEWGCLSAASIGAPHKRDRIWVVAYADCIGLQGSEFRMQVRTKKGAFQEVDPGAIQRRFDIPEPYGLRSLNGLANGVDRIRCLGNGQVPAVAETAWRILSQNRGCR